MESILFDNADEGILMMNKFASEVLKKELPSATILPHYYAGVIGGKFTYKNLFKNTKYETTKQSLLCHFTSLQGLSYILKNGYLRLSEFSHFSDLNELNFGASIFDNIFLSTEKLNNLVKNQKQNSFALSACMSNDEVIRNSYMWEVYGNSSKGAIIEFEIQNTTVESLLHGKIQYGDKGLKPLKNIFMLAKEFHNEHKFFPTNFPIEIKELLAFHKEKKYEDENEVRIFINLRKNEYDQHNHIATYYDINNSNEVKCFFRLFLEGRKDVFKHEGISDELIEDYFSFYPTIKIKRIILGNNLTVEQKLPIVTLLHDLNKQFKYDFKIEHINNESELLAWR